MLMEYNPPCLERFGVSGEVLLKMVREMGYEVWRAKASGRVKFQGLEPGEEYCNVVCRAA
jgi:hypothetical protein